MKHLISLSTLASESSLSVAAQPSPGTLSGANETAPLLSAGPQVLVGKKPS